MTPNPMTLLAVAVLAATLAGAGPPPGPAAAEPAAEPAAADSLDLFLRDLADSTDTGFGAQSVDYDTTGLDSLASYGFELPAGRPERRSLRLGFYPVARFHRAEGAVAGAGVRTGSFATGTIDLSGSYGFSSREGRYAFEYRRTLWRPRGALSRRRSLEEGRIGDAARLDLTLRYARATLAFMPEHARPGFGTTSSLISGRNAQSVYESRGFEGALTLWAGDVRLQAGVRAARDQAMPLATRWSVFGERDEVPSNELARPDRYTEPFGGVAYLRRDWELASLLEARGGGGDRWRVRGAAAKAQRLGPDVKAIAQIEAGAAAADAPVQRRFEVGGARLVPSLPYGVGAGDHLLGGRLELVGAMDALRSLGIRPPDWVVLNPWAFAHGGAVWDDPGGRGVLLSRPPGSAWKGAAGGGLVYRLGVPDPDVWMRFGVAWPIGPDSGVTRFFISFDRTFDLLGRL